MNVNEAYEKIPWVYKIPEVISENVLSKNKLRSLSLRSKQSLIISIIETLSDYFSVVTDYYYDPKDVGSVEGEDTSGLNSLLTIWLSGLGDLNITQIVGGLLDILNMRTEYKKWPPKSVMQFHAVCIAFKPAYHEIRTFSGNKQIKCDALEKRKRLEEIQEKTMREVYKMLGKDYEKVKEKRIKNSSI